MRYDPTGHYLVMERWGPRRIEIADAATGAVVATFSAGQCPRWIDADNLVCESPDGTLASETVRGWMLRYVPANRGQIDANGDSLWAVSDLSTTRVSDGAASVGTIHDAREPRIGKKDIAVRDPATGVLRLATRIGDLGLCEDSRWSSETLCWWLGGRVWGRTTPDQPTVELTVPGRACSHACPYWDGSQLWVGLVLDEGELWVARWSDLVARNGLGWRVGSSSGSNFDWDMRA